MRSGTIARVSFLVFLYSSIFAQPSNPDSLWQLLQRAPSDSKQDLELHLELANYWVYYNLDSTATHINYVLAHPQVDELLPPPFFRHYLIKGWWHQGRSELLLAKEYMEEAYRRGRQGADFVSLLELRMNLGSVLTELRDSTAWDFAEALITDVDTSRSQSEREAWLIGNQYQVRILEAAGRDQEALERLLMLKESAALRKTPAYANGIYNSLGVVLGKTGDHQRALFYHREALALPDLYPYEYNDHLLKLAEGFYDLRKYDSCGHYLQQVTTGSSDLYPPERWLYYYNRARLAFQQEQVDTSLYYLRVGHYLRTRVFL